MTDDADWPALPLDAWEPTRATLHMWCQIVGKVRLALSPYVNHWWQVPLYVSARGLTTSAIPYKGKVFEVEFDFIGHVLRISVSDGATRTLRLAPKSVAAFHAEFMAALAALGIEVHIWTMPVEIPNPIAFDKDTVHAAYDPGYASRFWQALIAITTVLNEFRGGFLGKSSPVHFFWGSFDLAVTRFSGRHAPPMPDADIITREGYSHEVSSVGWWPGDETTPFPAFYSYAAPEPEGFGKAPVRPAVAFYDTAASQFRLKYDDVRLAPSPRRALLDFCQSTYEAAATLAKWDRAELERRAD
jgi:Family of unknown function (DUF5996)